MCLGASKAASPKLANERLIAWATGSRCREVVAMTRRRLRLLKGVLLLASLVVALGLGEAIVRLAAPQRGAMVPTYLRPDADLGNVALPHQNFHDRHGLPEFEYHVRTNNLGLRMDDDVNPSTTVRKAVALGDSYTFGWGVEVEKSFLYRVRSQVENNIASLQLLNAGVPGDSTGHVYKRFVRLADHVDLCAAVYFMCPNDPLENLIDYIDYRVTSYARGADGSIALKDEQVFTPFKRFLLLNTPYRQLIQGSHLVTLTKNVVRGWAGTKGLTAQQIPAGGSDQEKLLIDVTLAHTARLDGFARSQQIPLMVVWIPTSAELFDADDPSNDVFARLRDGLCRQGFDFFDPLPAMRQAVAGRFAAKDIFLSDGHFTEIGNAVYADAVTDPVQRFLKQACER
jgi:hypothetical protein